MNNFENNTVKKTTKKANVYLIIGHHEINPERNKNINDHLKLIFKNNKGKHIYIYTMNEIGTSFVVKQFCKKSNILYSSQNFMSTGKTPEEIIKNTNLTNCYCIGNSKYYKDFLEYLKEKGVKVNIYACN